MRRFARGWFEQFKGLMFDNTPGAELEFDLGIEKYWGASVHTFFMRYSIKVEWLNSSRVLVDSKELRPWIMICFPRAKARYIVERRIE